VVCLGAGWVSEIDGRESAPRGRTLVSSTLSGAGQAQVEEGGGPTRPNVSRPRGERRRTRHRGRSEQRSSTCRGTRHQRPQLGRLTAADLDYYVAEFTRAGFRGGINYYRNFHRNWEITPELATAKVPQPALFVAGAKDGVIRGATADGLDKLMRPWVPGLTKVVVVPEVGHWVQQEAVEATNSALLAFLAGLERKE
jgi:pimeloyl-ACP methyl ester carboxylesterase